MAKRGRKPKKKINLEANSHIIKSVFSVGLFLLGGIISVVLVLGASDSGQIGAKIKIFLTTSFGIFVIFVPVIILILAVHSLGLRSVKFLNKRVLLGLFMLFLSALGLFGEMAGTVGESIKDFTASLISIPGSALLYVALLIISIVLITNKGIHDGLNLLQRSSGKGDLRHKDKDDEDSEKVELDDELPDQLDVKDGEIEEDEKILLPEPELLESKAETDYEVVAPPSAPVEEENAGQNEGDHTQSGQDNSYVEEKEERVSLGRIPFSNRVWTNPPLDLLSDVPNKSADAGNVSERAKIIEETLRSFGIKAPVSDYKIGPAFTRYAISPSVGTKTSKIQSLATDLALRLKSPSGSVRIEAPIPGTNLIGIEVPNFSPSLVTLKSILASEEMKRSQSKLAVAIGHDVAGKPIVQDMTRWPHCLVAGATGTGKSVMLNTIIASLLFRCSPSECRFIMIDPKMVELSQYNGIPHLLTPVVTDAETKAVSAFAWAVSEMDRRYKEFSAVGARNIEAYNQMSGFQAEPYIVIVVDELADMMMVAASEIEKYIIRLAQKSRAVGLHLVLATQRPSVNIITGTIKANVPTRMAFKVTSLVDSRVIIDQAGAETLIGRGDMLFTPPDDNKPRRVQGAYVSDKEIGSLVNYLRNSGVEPDYKEEIFEQKVMSNKMSGGPIEGADDKLVRALEIVIQDGKASASYLQRKLGIGYSRAARMIDDMEDAKVIGQARGSKPRDVLVANVEEALNRMGDYKIPPE